jgi:type IV pilus assembly protein PilE
MKKQVMGLSLIELLVAICIVTVLAGLAVPSYQSHLLTSRRGVAKTQLMSLYISQEEYRLRNNSYATISDIEIPSNEFYTFNSSDVSATTFNLTATAKSSQVKDVGCTSLTLDQSLKRTPTECW